MKRNIIADLNLHACLVLTRKDLFGFIRRNFIIYFMHRTFDVRGLST